MNSVAFPLPTAAVSNCPSVPTQSRALCFPQGGSARLLFLQSFYSSLPETRPLFPLDSRHLWMASSCPAHEHRAGWEMEVAAAAPADTPQSREQSCKVGATCPAGSQGHIQRPGTGRSAGHIAVFLGCFATGHSGLASAGPILAGLLTAAVPGDPASTHSSCRWVLSTTSDPPVFKALSQMLAGSVERAASSCFCYRLRLVHQAWHCWFPPFLCSFSRCSHSRAQRLAVTLPMSGAGGEPAPPQGTEPPQHRSC